jgi:hypothetical protein
MPVDVYYRKRNLPPKEDRYVKKTMIIVAAIAFLAGISAAGETTTGGNLPKILLLGSISNVFEPVRFDHAEEVAGTPKGCTGMCHVPKKQESREGRK